MDYGDKEGKDYNDKERKITPMEGQDYSDI
jgi:hypothetical protein